MNLCVPRYKVPPTSVHQYLEALKNHVTVHKDISTTVFYLGDEIYRNEYITVVNDIYWLPCLWDISNHLFFDYAGSLIMNHKGVVNEGCGRGNVYIDKGKASDQCQKRQICFFGLSVPYDHRVDHQLTEEDIIFWDQ